MRLGVVERHLCLRFKVPRCRQEKGKEKKKTEKKREEATFSRMVHLPSGTSFVIFSSLISAASSSATSSAAAGAMRSKQ